MTISKFIYEEMLMTHDQNISVTVEPILLHDALKSLEEIHKVWEKMSMDPTRPEWTELRYAWMGVRNLLAHIKPQVIATLTDSNGEALPE